MTLIKCLPTDIGRNVEIYTSSRSDKRHGTFSPDGDVTNTCGSIPSKPSSSNILSHLMAACLSASPVADAFVSDTGADAM